MTLCPSHKNLSLYNTGTSASFEQGDNCSSGFWLDVDFSKVNVKNSPSTVIQQLIHPKVTVLAPNNLISLKELSLSVAHFLHFASLSLSSQLHLFSVTLKVANLRGRKRGAGGKGGSAKLSSRGL